ncbi:MAG: STAS domain-containing protein [Burkholderiales bacterium]|nr:STAS domain-containing protein [Burkholderiales bacterium]
MFRFPDSVTFDTAPAALEQAAQALAQPQPMFDLGGCRQFDSSLLAVLLELSRRAAARGLRCAFQQPAPNLRKLAHLYGVDAMLFDVSADTAA